MNLIEIRRIDILCLLETDVVGSIPQLPGFRASTDSSMNVIRTIIYVKNNKKGYIVVTND